MIDLTFLTFVLVYLLEYETELQAADSKLWSFKWLSWAFKSTSQQMMTIVQKNR